MSVSYWPVVPEARSREELRVEIEMIKARQIAAMPQAQMNAYTGAFEGRWEEFLQETFEHGMPNSFVDWPVRKMKITVEQIPQKLLLPKNPDYGNFTTPKP